MGREGMGRDEEVAGRYGVEADGEESRWGRRGMDYEQVGDDKGRRKTREILTRLYIC